MPTPDWEEPLNSFLKSIMMLRYGSAEGKLGQQKLALEQQKFNAQAANHQADMQQRAQQFGQELKLRQDEAAAQAEFRKSQLAQGEATRQDASQERFRAAGGLLMPTPTDKSIDLGVTQPQAPNPASILMPRPSTQPVGPLPTQEVASQIDPAQNLPMQQVQQPPINMTLSADAQRPDPTRYQQTVAPLGTPAGQEAYFPTLKGKVLEQKEAADEADTQIVTPEMERALSDLGLKAGDTIHKSQLSLLENAATRKLAREQAATLAQTNMLNANDQKQRDRDLRMAMLQITAAKKASGGLDEADIKANHTSVMGNLDSFHELSKKEQTAERVKLQEEGLPAPRKAGQRIESTEFFANRAIQSSNRINELLADPAKAAVLMKRIGPALGREGNLEQAIGASSSFPNTPEGNDARELLQEFRSLNNYLTFQEGQSLFGGRIPIQLMQQLQASSPQVTKALPEFRGAINAVKTNSEDALIAGEKYRLDGKMRPNFLKDHNIVGRTVRDVEITNPPPAMSGAVGEGEIKTFRDGKGGSHTVTKRDGKLYETVRE